MNRNNRIAATLYSLVCPKNISTNTLYKGDDNDDDDDDDNNNNNVMLQKRFSKQSSPLVIETMCVFLFRFTFQPNRPSTSTSSSSSSHENYTIYKMKVETDIVSTVKTDLC